PSRLIQTSQYNLREHGESVTPAAESIFNLPPQPEAPAGGKGTQGNAAGKQIAKGHHRLNQFNAPLRKLLLKLYSVPCENDPRQRAIGACKRAGGWQFP